MKHLKHLILIVTSLCLVASSAIVSNAAQLGANPKIGGTISAEPNTSATTPLKQPLTVNMAGSNSLCYNLLQKIESLGKLADIELFLMLTQQGDNPISWPGIEELTHHPYKGCVEGCCSPTKSFSVQDQQAAGCANSDTVKQCMDKLMKHCISCDSIAAIKDEIKTRLKKTQEKSNNISIRTKQFSEEIKNLLSIMP